MAILLLFIGLGIIQIVMAVWGGIVSAASLPANTKKAPHILGFAVLGMAGLLLTVAIGWTNYQGGVADQREREEAKRLQESLRAQLQSGDQRQEYMRSELDSVRAMIETMSKRTGNSELKELAKSVAKMAEDAKRSAPKHYEVQATDNLPLTEGVGASKGPQGK
jgi:hypothetical protein